ncbi:MAG: helicase-related protein [Acidimicrobiia bacterium]
MTLDALVAGAQVSGIDPSGVVTIVAVEWHGSAAVTLTYRDAHGQVQERLLYRSDEGTFSVVEGTERFWSFDADGGLFRLAAEARRIQLAHLFDPMLAVTTSQIDPLPHQIQAVYGEMLPRQPLRFLLADDPGAGKTIMAGLYVKELMLRGDAHRVLIVAPGSLVAQWQDELYEKFGLSFDIVTREMLDASYSGDAFRERNLLIARIDQLSRRDDLVERLAKTDWDLVVVDEAHRMSAHFFSGEVQKTRRYQLGEVLGSVARHFLLMTATPHAGKEEDFQLFLALLDADRFEGRFRDGVHTVDASDLMRRMVKEKLLRFDGRPLFPERRAYTVSYPLSPEELTLYDEVTAYVREQMNRADRLTAAGEGRRGNTVGFALTVLQRRLASSPEAIYQSLRRRRRRLEARVVEERQLARARRLGATPQEERLSTLLGSEPDPDLEAIDELEGAEREDLEVEVADAASAASTIEELQEEIAILAQLEELARLLVSKGVDRKWAELSGLLSEQAQMFDPSGNRRKLIVFTEHRDTMNYLVDRLRTFLGSNEAVVAISGSTGREERRVIQQTFTQSPDCLVLVATDAAGEGINLQRAHLVINYDLPWNPNRIEQRFGRVHRIGQEEVCHMWNLVAEETREAQVYLRLLDKIEEQRRAYQGQVFDVLGAALPATELRRLLIEAIRYGDQPEVRARLFEVIDARIGDGLGRLIAEQALSTEVMARAEVDRIRHHIEELQARRLQPHYISAFFRAAFQHLGGSLREPEPGRFELQRVPEAVRRRDREIGDGAPVALRYERITFDKELTRLVGCPPAELVAPGHPLLTALIDLVAERHRFVLTQGATLVDDSDDSETLRVLVMLEHSIADARSGKSAPHTIVSRRFEFVEIPEHGPPRAVPGAPYLDYRPATVEEISSVAQLGDQTWLSSGLERIGLDHAIEVAVPDHLAVVRLHTLERVEKTRAAVRDRLTREINYWDQRATELRLQADAGRTPRMNPERAEHRADELAGRLERRMRTLDQEASLKPLPPKVVGGALVVPAGLLRRLGGERTATPESFARNTAEVERRAVAAVLAAEDELGHRARDMNDEHRNHPGYDILTSVADRGDAPDQLFFIEVKGRIEGSDSVTVSRNEMLTALNTPDRYILALVEVSASGAEHDRVRYLSRPFAGVTETHFAETSRNFAWAKLWSAGVTPGEMFAQFAFPDPSTQSGT